MEDSKVGCLEGLVVLFIMLLIAAIPVSIIMAGKQDAQRNSEWEQLEDHLQRKRLGNGWLYEKYSRYPFYVPDPITTTPERQ